MASDINKFIAEHSLMLKRIIAFLTAIWFLSGILIIDYINPAVFVALWVPPGVLGAWFAKKW